MPYVMFDCLIVIFIPSRFSMCQISYYHHMSHIIIAKNIRYLLWNRSAWRSFHNIYQAFLAPCIRCTVHLCESCRLKLTLFHILLLPGADTISKCRQLLTYGDVIGIREPDASNCDVTVTDCSHVVSMGAFLSQWRWGLWFKEFVKYTSVPSCFKFHCKKNVRIRELFGKWRHY